MAHWMVCLVYSVLDPASVNIAEALKKKVDFRYVDRLRGNAHFASDIADIIVESKGGYGAFRDFAEIIIEAKTKKKLYRKDDDESRQN